MYQIWDKINSFIYKSVGTNKEVSNKEKIPKDDEIDDKIDDKIDDEIPIIESYINQKKLFQDFQEVTNIDGHNKSIPSIIKYLEKEKLYMTQYLEIKKKEKTITIDEVIYNTHIKELLNRFQLLYKLLEIKKNRKRNIINDI